MYCVAAYNKVFGSILLVRHCRDLCFIGVNLEDIKLKRRNYNIGPSSLPCVRNWSLKFEACAIGPSSFQNEPYKLFY